MLNRQPQSADTAFAEYAAETRRHAALMTDIASTNVERSAQAHRMLAAERQWKALAPADDGPIQPIVHERNRLACEGTLLITAFGGLVGLMLPGLEESFWPLAIAAFVVAALGGWTVHFIGRWAAYIRRIL